MFGILLLIITQFAASADLTSPRSQSDPFEGTWEGELTHDGGFADSYKFQLNLRKEGDHYTGTTVVRVEEIFAEMTISGEALSKQLLILKDLEIRRFEINEGMEWCLKTYQLLRSKDGKEEVLQGTWQGKTSFADCIPGKLTLRRAKERA